VTKTDEDSGCAPADGEGTAVPDDAGEGEGSKGTEPEGSNKDEDDGQDKKKPKKVKKPLGPKAMKVCQKKIPGLDGLLIKQYDFLDKSLPARILLSFDVAIKHLVGSAPPDAPKPNPKAAAMLFLAKVKHKIKNRGKIKVAAGGGLPDAVANAPNLSGGSAKKLPPVAKAEP
jgi:hypothetical protein